MPLGQCLAEHIDYRSDLIVPVAIRARGYTEPRILPTRGWTLLLINKGVDSCCIERVACVLMTKLALEGERNNDKVDQQLII